MIHSTFRAFLLNSIHAVIWSYVFRSLPPLQFCIFQSCIFSPAFFDHAFSVNPNYFLCRAKIPKSPPVNISAGN